MLFVNYCHQFTCDYDDPVTKRGAPSRLVAQLERFKHGSAQIAEVIGWQTEYTCLKSMYTCLFTAAKNVEGVSVFRRRNHVYVVKENV